MVAKSLLAFALFVGVQLLVLGAAATASTDQLLLGRARRVSTWVSTGTDAKQAFVAGFAFTAIGTGLLIYGSVAGWPDLDTAGPSASALILSILFAALGLTLWFDAFFLSLFEATWRRRSQATESPRLERRVADRRRRHREGSAVVPALSSTGVVAGDAPPLPPLSVVVLTCDSASTITTCLESLVAQEHTAFETVVVDDGSTDGTLDLVRTYEGRLQLPHRPQRRPQHPEGPQPGAAGQPPPLCGLRGFRQLGDAGAWTGRSLPRSGTCRTSPWWPAASSRTLPGRARPRPSPVRPHDHELTGQGLLQFFAGNSALDTERLSGDVFDESFVAAEDLDLLTRVRDHHRYEFVPAMVVHRSSRDTFGQYAARCIVTGP